MNDIVELLKEYECLLHNSCEPNQILHNYTQ